MSTAKKTTGRPGAEAIAERGWLAAHKWLLLRRAAQASFILLFMVGPWTGFWIVKGNFATSLTLDILPLSDPFILIQSFVAGHVLETTAMVGAAIVAIAYLLLGGRSYCSWACPINPVTDLAHWARQRLASRAACRFPARPAIGSWRWFWRPQP